MTPGERLAVELGARVGALDGRKIVPMLCGRDETGERVLSQGGWLFELKLDGVRIVADKRADQVALTYRGLRDATSSYPEIQAALAKLEEERVVLDGEIVAFDDEGRPDFQRLGTRIQRQGEDARRAAAAVPVVYVVFDVLAIGDRDVTAMPIEARKAILERVLADSSRTGGLVRLHPTLSDGAGLFRLCREQGLEGVVAKREGSTYRSDERSPDWVKVKCELDADLVVVGWTEGEGGRSRLGALDLAVYDKGRLVIRGRVGSGLDEGTIDALYERLLALEVPRSMAEGKPKPKKVRHHVRPEIVVSVRYLGVSNEGLLRFPVFRGVRPDLAPEDCTLDAVVEKISLAASTSFESESPRADGPRRVRLTAPSAVALLDGTTKDAICMYYEAVGPRMLPFLRGRTCPLLATRAVDEGVSLRPLSPLPTWTPSWVHASATRVGKEEMRGILVDDVETLRFIVEAGGVSLLMLPMREATPSIAEVITLRIEGEGAGTSRAARSARELAARTGLSSFVKLEGAALEVLVAIGRAPVEAAQLLGALFARLLAGSADGVTVACVQAPVAPYGVVAPLQPGVRASASMPLSWEELEAAGPSSPRSLSLDEVATAITAGAPDPLAGLLGGDVDLARAVETIEQIIAAGGWAPR